MMRLFWIASRLKGTTGGATLGGVARDIFNTIHRSYDFENYADTGRALDRKVSRIIRKLAKADPIHIKSSGRTSGKMWLYSEMGRKRDVSRKYRRRSDRDARADYYRMLGCTVKTGSLKLLNFKKSCFYKVYWVHAWF